MGATSGMDDIKLHKCTNCSNKDRGKPNTWYIIVKHHSCEDNDEPM